MPDFSSMLDTALASNNVILIAIIVIGIIAQQIFSRWKGTDIANVQASCDSIARKLDANFADDLLLKTMIESNTAKDEALKLAVDLLDKRIKALEE